MPVASRELTSDQYAIDGLGNLYFYSSVDHLLPTFSNNKVYLLSQDINKMDYSGSEIYYKCVIKIAKVIVDTGSSELASSALMQSVMYSIMDFMDVYTFGETTANMIAEIGYTQAMTITSTAITAPVLALGAWATLSTQEVQKQVTTLAVNTAQQTASQQASQEIAKITFGQTIQKLLGSKTLGGLLTQIAVKTTIGVVTETIEEIIIDGLVETYFQSLVTSMGGSADMGHWVSTLMTTARETKFFSSFFSTGGETSQIGSISQELAVIDNTISNMNQNAENMIGQQISEQFLESHSQLESIDQEATLSFKKLIKAGLLVGLSLIMPSMAGLNLYAISKALGGTINQAFISANNFRPQIQSLARRNMMVSRQALSKFEYVNIEGLFYETPIMDSILETASPTVETMPQVQPIAVHGSVFMSVFGFRADGHPITPTDIIRDAEMSIKIEEGTKKRVIEESQKKIASLGGAITAQGEFGQTIKAIKSSSNFDSTQFAKIAKTLTKYYEAIHSTKSFSIDGIYDIEASTHHILQYFSKKINNGEMLNNFEEEALDLIIAIMKSNQGSHGSVYQGLFSRNGWKTVASGGTPSGVTPFYKLFLSKIARSLFDNGIIYTDPDINLIESVREFTRMMGRSEAYYWKKIYGIKSGHMFGATQVLLSELYISLEKLVFSHWLKSPSESFKCIKSLEGHFDFLQFIQGDLVKNKFYTELYLISYKIMDIISSTLPYGGMSIPNYGGTLTSLDLDVLTSTNLQNMIFLIKNTNGPPPLVSLERLRSSIINDLKPYITAAQLDKILFLVDNYKASIVSYYKGLDLLSNFKDGYRKALINDLINSKITPILQECSSIAVLSTLLMGINNNLGKFFYDNKEGIYKRINIFVLRRIKLRVELWEVNDFDPYGYIDQATLDLLKEEIKDKIDGFITYEKLAEYNQMYTINPKEQRRYDRYWYVQPGFESELEVIQALYEAVVAFTGNAKTSLRRLGKILGGESGLYQSTLGFHFSIKTFRRMVSTLEKYSKKDTIWRIPPKTTFFKKNGFLSRLKLAQRQEIYENAKIIINDYMEEHGIDRPRIWYEESVEGYHVIQLLKKHLGFDLLSFTSLNKDSFSNTILKNKFHRHHFRSGFFRKLSCYVQDLILTDSKNHQKYESYSEAEMLVIMNGFDKMMNMEGSGRDKDGNAFITKQDVIDIFDGNEWVLYGPNLKGGKKGNQGWFFSDEGFDGMLTEFNERKILLKNEGLDQFIIKKYDTVYERFYLNFPNKSPSKSNIADADGFYSLVVPHPWLGDFAMGMNMDAWLLYPEF